VTGAAPLHLAQLDRDIAWRFEQFDPVTGESNEITAPPIGANGACLVAPPAHGHDWVLVISQ